MMDVEIGRIDRSGGHEFPAFCKALHRQDVYLSLVWSRGRERWLIRRRSPRTGDPINVMWLEGPNGEYRDPGEWVIQELQAMDMYNRVPLRNDMRAWAHDVERRVNDEPEAAAKAKKDAEWEEAFNDHIKPYMAHRTRDRIYEVMDPTRAGAKSGRRPTKGSADWKPKRAK